MHKIGVMMMGSRSDSPKKVKEVILEVETKTKIVNICDYLLEMGKITSLDVSVAAEKDGKQLQNSTTIAQVLRNALPIDGVLKLFLYENQSRNQIAVRPRPRAAEPAVVSQGQKMETLESESRSCCC